MAATLSLATLRPEKPTFQDIDGKEYPFALPQDFDLITQAKRYNIRKEMGENEKKRQENPGDVQWAREWLRLIQDSVQLHIPTLPEESLRNLTQKECLDILEWWRANVDFPQQRETPTKIRSSRQRK